MVDSVGKHPVTEDFDLMNATIVGHCLEIAHHSRLANQTPQEILDGPSLLAPQTPQHLVSRQ